MTKKGSSEFFLNKIEIFGGQKGKLSNFCSKRAVMNCSKNMLWHMGRSKSMNWSRLSRYTWGAI